MRNVSSFKIFLNTTSFLCKVDRFLALFWNIYYAERVTLQKTIVIIICTKLVLFFLAIIMMILGRGKVYYITILIYLITLDPGWFTCRNASSYQCKVCKRSLSFFTWTRTCRDLLSSSGPGPSLGPIPGPRSIPGPVPVRSWPGPGPGWNLDRTWHWTVLTMVM